MRLPFRSFVFGLAVTLAGAVSAQEPTGRINLELNHIKPTDDGGCRLTVIARNGLERPVNKLGLEIWVFNADELADHLLRINFPRISVGKTKIIQFALADKSCESISRIHVNNVLNCVPDSVKDVYCSDLLDLSNRTPIKFGD